MLVEDFLHGQGDDDFVAALEEGFDLRQGIRRIIERHKEVRARSDGRLEILVRTASTSSLIFPFAVEDGEVVERVLTKIAFFAMSGG